MKQIIKALHIILVATGLAFASPIAGTAQDIPESPAIGPETQLPLPRFVSLRAAEANVRRGPSLSHRIDWVFKRRNMPLQITGEYGHWRRVIDRDGEGGWIHFRLLSGARTVVVTDPQVALRSRPSAEATEVAIFENGVVAWLGPCEPVWCELTAGGYKGWAPKSAVWGVSEEEMRE